MERGGAGRGEEGPRSGGGLGVACVGNVSPGIPPGHLLFCLPLTAPRPGYLLIKYDI